MACQYGDPISTSENHRDIYGILDLDDTVKQVYESLPTVSKSMDTPQQV
jgi:hypothetical protein